MHDRHAPRPPFWPTVVLLVLASVIYCAPLFAHLDWHGQQDWDQFAFRYETPRVALLRDRQWPVWNPYASGGTALLAHPHSPVFSPWYALTLALGAPLGLRVQVVVFMALGAVGMAALMRRLGAGRAAGIAAGIAFMMSAHYALHITEGHLEWTPLGGMPWVALGILAASEHAWSSRARRATIAAAVAFAALVTLGAVYISAIYALFFTLWMGFESARSRRLRPLAVWVLAAVLAGGLSAIKLVPMTAFVSAYPRAGSDPNSTLRPLVIGALHPGQADLYRQYRGSKTDGARFDPGGPIPAWSMDTEYHEYGSYLGIAGLALAGLGLVVSWRRAWPLYAAGGAAIAIALADRSPIDLWALVRTLPLYGQMQVPSRMIAAIVFSAAVAVGFGLDAIAARTRDARPTLVRAVPWCVAAALYVELAVMGHSLFRGVFNVPPVALESSDRFAQRPPPPQAGALVPGVMKSLLYPRLIANWGAVDGYENLQVTRGRVRTTADPDYRGEAYLVGEGTAAVEQWTMGRVRIRVDAASPSMLVMNQNYDPGWRVARATAPAQVEPAARTADGLVAAAVTPQDAVVEFSYWPPGLTAGAGISAAAALVCVLGAAWKPSAA